MESGYQSKSNESGDYRILADMHEEPINIPKPFSPKPAFVFNSEPIPPENLRLKGRLPRIVEEKNNKNY